MREPEQQTLLEVADIQKSVQRLKLRDWEFWSIALLLFSAFAGGILASLYSRISEGQGLPPLATRFVWLVLLGLVILVVLLNAYLIDRKRSLTQLWRRYLLQAEALHKERELGMLDPLTQVYSRRFFEESIPREAHRCDRAGRPLSLVLVELDNLKELNRGLGHLVGDQVLLAVAGVLQDTLRASDQVFRYGGDEFVVVLPETPAEGAAIVEARLEELITRNSEIQKSVGRPLTVTIGRATYTKGDKLDSVIDQLERAMDSVRSNPSAIPTA